MPGTPPARYAYLGPEGTFTEAALRQVPAAERAELVACASVDAALDAVRAGEVDAAMVPIENSVEGGVSATLDALAAGEPLMVVREVLVPVTFVVAARPGTRLDDVRVVSTHPHAQAQCRRWLSSALPGARYLPAMSTAAAAAGLAGRAPGAEAAPYDAALCAPIAARRYRLDVLAEGVEDNGGAVTRFVLVGRPAPPPPATGADKTTLVVHLPDDHAGALLELLEQFAAHGVNLTRIESRPMGDTLGRYSFSIDCEGHVDDERVAEALMGLHRVTPLVRFVGSYPRADGVATKVGPATSDAAFTQARSWLQRLREGRLG
jgi:prephenate dehydratase